MVRRNNCHLQYFVIVIIIKTYRNMDCETCLFRLDEHLLYENKSVEKTEGLPGLLEEVHVEGVILKKQVEDQCHRPVERERTDTKQLETGSHC